ncbi:phosphoadenylyl-sulfate reductase [Tropicibacter naphthalenivorans]|uniref:Adenosine 5'-phosphosulfate reductase n=1 Tax=Tropicibacter naphthalenivorans TaxID=441103 RepID=A0A0P1H0V6_9RHOB|nr:phosphoadenylyl-sulfate reductase [Tropicibacter naphthalenivorans]CUH82627.1 Phosphoadenosine phosphosulfate reductase [Tropicibacter naphthalenivorans]SMD08957.1 phosphoadenylylsulfate reductase (thioredoxin) [Tropicibacter naphthalenivorans]
MRDTSAPVPGPTYETNQRLDLRDRAAGLGLRYKGQAAQDVLAGVIRHDFAGKIGLVSSFGTEAAVLLHMVSRIDPYVPVIFLDTGKHFAETLDYRERLIAQLGLCNTQRVHPSPAGVAADDPTGALHGTNPDLCCHVRKTLPMLAALRSLGCWITGRKRGQASTRAELPLFETQDRWIKVNPLRDWTAEDVSDYFAQHDLPQHPLMAQGYLSIGCAPCTRAVKPGEDPRAGRWADSGKTECGIHFENGKLVRKGPQSG